MPTNTQILADILTFGNPDYHPVEGDPDDIQLASDVISVGVEVELENLASNWRGASAVSSWEVVNDGSLRGVAREIRSRSPVRGNELKQNLLQLFRGFHDNSLTRHSNARTSMHVHVNVLDMSRNEFRCLLAVGSLADSILFKHTGPNRPFTGYSAPTANNLAKLLGEASELRLHSMSTSLADYLGFAVDSIESRYQSVNLQALVKHGTVEFRHFETPETREDMVKIINACMNVKLAARMMAQSIAEANYKEPDFLYENALAALDVYFPDYQTSMDKESFCELFELGILLAASEQEQHEPEEDITLFQPLPQAESESNASAPDSQARSEMDEWIDSNRAWLYREPLASASPPAPSPGAYNYDSIASPQIDDTSTRFSDYRIGQGAIPMSHLHTIARMVGTLVSPRDLYRPAAPSPTRASRNGRNNSELFRGVQVAANTVVIAERANWPLLDSQINVSNRGLRPGAVIRLGEDNNLYAVATQEVPSDRDVPRFIWALVNIAPEIHNTTQGAV